MRLRCFLLARRTFYRVTVCALGLAGCATNLRPPNASDAPPEVYIFEERAPEFVEVDQGAEAPWAEQAAGGEHGRPSVEAAGDEREPPSGWGIPPPVAAPDASVAPTQPAPPPAKRFTLARPNATVEIVGVVRDLSTNKRLVDSTVTIHSAALGVERTVATDQVGAFRFEGQPPGEYTLSVEADLYWPVARTGLIFRPGARLKVDVRLPCEVCLQGL